MSGEERQISQRTADAPFGSVNASRLNSHGAVTALLSLMEENGCGPQAMELSYTISAIDNMEKRYSELLSDVQSKREQLAETSGTMWIRWSAPRTRGARAS